jgi:subtilisin family serine protease
VADRIVYNQDFMAGGPNAQDVDGHGSNVSSIVASSDPVHTGMAPAVDIVHLKVLDDTGGGSFAALESALQWVVANVDTYNIASINMSLGDPGNYNSPVSLYGIGDELAALVSMDVIVVSASGNAFGALNSVQA